MSLKKLVLSALVAIFGITTSSQSFAISHGLEVVSVGGGAVSVSVGKAKNNMALRYVGWGLISVGGTVLVGDAGLMVFYAAFMGALMGSMFSISLSPISSVEPRDPNDFYPYHQNRVSVLTEGEVTPTLNAAMKEVRAEVSLASDSHADTREMVIQSIADALSVDVHTFATDFRTYIHGLKTSSEVVASSIHCTQDPEKIKVISALFSNYAKAHALVASHS